MKKKIFLTLVCSLALNIMVVYAQITNGDFDNGLNGWSTETSACNCGQNPNTIEIINEDGNKVAELHRQGIDTILDNKHTTYSSLWYTDYSSTLKTEWEISADIKLEIPFDPKNDNRKTISSILLYSRILNEQPKINEEPDFKIEIKNQGISDIIIWKTPTDHGEINFKPDIYDKYQSFKFRYNPFNGYVKLSIGTSKLYEGFTVPEKSVKTLFITTSGNGKGQYSASNLFVKDVKYHTIGMGNQTISLLHNIPNGDFGKGFISNVTGGIWTKFNGNYDTNSCNVTFNEVDSVMDLFQA